MAAQLFRMYAENSVRWLGLPKPSGGVCLNLAENCIRLVIGLPSLESIGWFYHAEAALIKTGYAVV